MKKVKVILKEKSIEKLIKYDNDKIIIINYWNNLFVDVMKGVVLFTINLKFSYCSSIPVYFYSVYPYLITLQKGGIYISDVRKRTNILLHSIKYGWNYAFLSDGKHILIEDGRNLFLLQIF